VSAILDRERLSLFTDGDPAEEKFLAGLFKAQAELSIEMMCRNCSSGEKTGWKEAAHKLKGSAANLGAAQLAGICAAAEQAYAEEGWKKREHLDRVVENYVLVRDLLAGSP
jgi:HPt (histidine-containing phosphotransfer) domain-containing protein